MTELPRLVDDLNIWINNLNRYATVTDTGAVCFYRLHYDECMKKIADIMDELNVEVKE